MDTTPREIKEVYESLKASMFHILELDPKNGWHWIIDAQACTLSDQLTLSKCYEESSKVA